MNWAGLEIDFEALRGYGWYNDTVEVRGVKYRRLHGYMVAALTEMAETLTGARDARDMAAGSATAAATSATSAAGSATAAAISATSAAGSATAAAGSATAAGTARDAALAAAGQAQTVQALYRYPAVGGTGDAVTLTTGAARTELPAGALVFWRVSHQNTGTVTVALDAVPAVPLLDAAGNPLVPGALVAGQAVGAVYTGVAYQALTPVAPSLRQSAPVYLAAGASTTLSGQSVLAAYEAAAAQTFNLTFNTEADYYQEDAAGGTDLSSGAFRLHSTGTTDPYAKLTLLGNGSIADSSANATAITNQGVTVSPTTKQFGTGAMAFDGSSWLSIADSALTYPASQDFVIECWVYLASAAAAFVLGKGAPGLGSGMLLYLMGGGQVQLQVQVSGVQQMMTSGAVLTYGAFKHLAIVRSGTSYTIYYDGTRVATATYSGAMDNVASQPWYIGKTSAHSPMSGYLDGFRYSLGTDRGYLGPTIAVPAAEFADAVTYAPGPVHITTLDASRIDLSGYEIIASASVTATTPAGTSLKFLVSFDGRSTWKTWTGSAWSAVTLSAANLEASGMTAAGLQSALAGWTPALGTTLDIAASFKTTDPAVSPSLDNIQVVVSDYLSMIPGVDYRVTKNKAAGTQTLTFTRLKAGNGSHVLDYA
jgi:hypothetical protein